jgi:uncharacterized protein (TIGR03000 family)
MVLMAALTTGSSAPDCWFGHHIGHGCWGGGYGGWGAGYGGCYGGTCGCYGGYGSCYGGFGHGGCYGGGWGGGYGGCSGPAYMSGCYGSCYGGMPYGGMPYMIGPSMPPAPMPPAPEKIDEPKKGGEASLNKAKLIVELPADAKLYIDDHLMKTTSARRVFNTPSLEKGQTYYYELRAEVVRDGKPYQETKQVIVRAGEEVRASFTQMDAAATLANNAQARAGR